MIMKKNYIPTKIEVVQFITSIAQCNSISPTILQIGVPIEGMYD